MKIESRNTVINLSDSDWISTWLNQSGISMAITSIENPNEVKIVIPSKHCIELLKILMMLVDSDNVLLAEIVKDKEFVKASNAIANVGFGIQEIEESMTGDREESLPLIDIPAEVIAQPIGFSELCNH